MTKFTIILSIFFDLAIFSAGIGTGIFISDILKSSNERENVEYQFVITDSTITVFDKDRTVGTVPLKGELYDLMVDDNL